MYLIAFPLLLIPFALYNMIAFLLDMQFSTTLFILPLLSGSNMPVSTGDMLVMLALLLLYSRFSRPRGSPARPSWTMCCRLCCSSP